MAMPNGLAPISDGNSNALFDAAPAEFNSVTLLTPKFVTQASPEESKAMLAGRTPTGGVVKERGFCIGEVIVRIVEPVRLPNVAVIVVVPAATEVAFPLEPGVLLTVATAVVDEPQVTDAVRF